jgi:hypothetical protein
MVALAQKPQERGVRTGFAGGNVHPEDRDVEPFCSVEVGHEQDGMVQLDW